MLNVERMRVLHAIAMNGSLNGAAEALHVTSSAVSQQLAKLEREVGQPLVERSGRGVRLTEAAEILVERTGQIMSLVRQTEADIEVHRAEPIGQLVLSAIPTAARELVPPALVALRASHPRLRVHLREAEPDEAVPAVERGDVDLAVIIDWSGAPIPLPSSMHRAALLEDVADVALPADHALANREFVELDEVAGESWISWGHGSICGAWLEDMLRARGIVPDIVHSVEEHQTRLALVAAGLGAAVMPRLGVGLPPPGVRLVPVRPALVRHVYVFWRADAGRRPGIRATVRALKQACADHARGRPPVLHAEHA